MSERVIAFVNNRQSLSDSLVDDYQVQGCIVISAGMAIEIVAKQIQFLLSQQPIDGFVINSDIVEEKKKLLELIEPIGLPIAILEDGKREVLLPRKSSSLFSTLVKRGFDIVIACCGIAMVGLVTIIIWPITQVQSPGPIFFKQKRVGKNGQVFTMYKFRSMSVDAEQKKRQLLEQNQVSSEHMFKLNNDPRVFPLGQKMRDWSIDELPQFINVLKGEMSFVGTRPPTIDEVCRYELHHFKRLTVTPGITGLWQVSGRSNIQDFEEVVALDTTYIDNWSLWLELKIMFKTIKVVLFKEGSQ